MSYWDKYRSDDPRRIPPLEALALGAPVALANATCPMLLQIADKGFKKAIEENPYLRAGMTCYDGKLTLKETALKQNCPWTDAEDLIKVW